MDTRANPVSGTPATLGVLGSLHGRFVHTRRVDVLAGHLAAAIPANSSVLDVGTGDGWIASVVAGRRPDLTISGIDVLERTRTHVPVRVFDGVHIPYPNRSVDAVMFVDVLHHTNDPLILLKEAHRVSRKAIVVKDHCRDGLLSGATLRFMDWIGNAPHGVVLPYNYWSTREWEAGFRALGLQPLYWDRTLQLYPKAVRWLFERSLHFIAVLT
jgi:SAM-dependent methyltransferase